MLVATRRRIHQRRPPAPWSTLRLSGRRLHRHGGPTEMPDARRRGHPCAASRNRPPPRAETKGPRQAAVRPPARRRVASVWRPSRCRFTPSVSFGAGEMPDKCSVRMTRTDMRNARKMGRGFESPRRLPQESPMNRGIPADAINTGIGACVDVASRCPSAAPDGSAAHSGVCGGGSCLAGHSRTYAQPVRLMRSVRLWSLLADGGHAGACALVGETSCRHAQCCRTGGGRPRRSRPGRPRGAAAGADRLRHRDAHGGGAAPRRGRAAAPFG